MDELISTGTTMRKRLQACKESLGEAWDHSWKNQYEYVKKLDEYSRKYDAWLGRWQRARAEAAAVGLEKQLRKRTCCVCAKTVPLSSHAFAYCGGCRHASIRRVDRPRYCSEACQRAHWLAGHMHFCPLKE